MLALLVHATTSHAAMIVATVVVTAAATAVHSVSAAGSLPAHKNIPSFWRDIFYIWLSNI
jgi:hypothetical protein